MRITNIEIKNFGAFYGTYQIDRVCKVFVTKDRKLFH